MIDMFFKQFYHIAQIQNNQNNSFNKWRGVTGEKALSDTLKSWLTNVTNLW
jgi:hypothetical protein